MSSFPVARRSRFPISTMMLYLVAQFHVAQEVAGQGIQDDICAAVALAHDAFRKGSAPGIKNVAFWPRNQGRILGV